MPNPTRIAFRLVALATTTLAALSLLALSSASVAAAAADLAADAGATDDAFVRDTSDYLSRLESLGWSGVVLAGRDGRPLYAAGHGLADREAGLRWSLATVASVGSITKQFTATAILRLEAEGRLAVTDTLAAHFAYVPADKAAITLHQLLTMSSGIVDLEGADDYDAIGRDDFVRRIFAQPLAFAPGTGYEYSNANYSLLGAVVEQLHNRSYEEVLLEELFYPLGLYETGYRRPLRGDQRLAQGYRDGTRWGTVLDRPMAPDGPFWVLRANGGIESTAYDMFRWAESLRNGRVLPAAARERMWTPHVREGADGDSFYGYGWSVRDLPDGTRVVSHNGSNGILFADLALVPAQGLVLFMASNVAADFRYGRRLLEQIGMRWLAGVPYPAVPRRADGPAAGHQAGSLDGRWTLTAAEGGAVELREDDGELIATPTDPSAYGALFSTTHLAPSRTAEIAARTSRLAAAIAAGDVAAILAHYDPARPRAEIERVWRQRLDELGADIGAIRSYEVLGVAVIDGEVTTTLRLAGERGERLRLFRWNGDWLVGIPPGLPPEVMTFFPNADGGWSSFDPRTGASRQLDVVVEAGRPKLRLAGIEEPMVLERREIARP